MNTHTAFKQLVSSGLQERIAETVINIIDETRRSNFDKLATKEELKGEIRVLSFELKGDITNLRTELREGIAGLRTELKEFEGKFSLLKWMVGISISLSIAIIAKLFLPSVGSF